MRRYLLATVSTTHLIQVRLVDPVGRLGLHAMMRPYAWKFPKRPKSVNTDRCEAVPLVPSTTRTIVVWGKVDINQSH